MSSKFFSYVDPVDSNETESCGHLDTSDVDYEYDEAIYEHDGENIYSHGTSAQDMNCDESSEMTTEDSDATRSFQGNDLYDGVPEQSEEEVDRGTQDRDQTEPLAVQQQPFFKRDAPSTTSMAQVFQTVANKQTRSECYISSDSSCSSASSRYSFSGTSDTSATNKSSTAHPSAPHRAAPPTVTQPVPVPQRFTSATVDSTARRPPAAGEPAYKKTTSTDPLRDISKALFPNSPPSTRPNPLPASSQPASSMSARPSAALNPFASSAAFTGTQVSKQPGGQNKPASASFFANTSQPTKTYAAPRLEMRTFLSPPPTTAAGPPKSGKPPNAPAQQKASKGDSFLNKPQSKSCASANSAVGTVNLAGSKRDAGGAAIAPPGSTFGTPQYQFPRSATVPADILSASASAVSSAARRTSLASPSTAPPTPQHAPPMPSVTPATKSSASVTSGASAPAPRPSVTPPAHPAAPRQGIAEEDLTPQSTYIAEPEPGLDQYASSQSSGMSPLTQQTQQAPLTSAPVAGGDGGQEAMARCGEVDAQVAALGERLQQARVSLKHVKTALVAQIAETSVAESKILSNDCMVTIAPLLLDLKEKLTHLRSQWEQSKLPPAARTSSTGSAPSAQVQTQQEQEVQAEVQAQAQEHYLDTNELSTAPILLITWV